jgi:tetratricopeptide (TPR) repeat protein
MVLAEHFERGKEPSRAATLYMHAARLAQRAQDLPAAIARAERAIGCGAQGEAYQETALILADAQIANSDYVRGLERAEEVLTLSRPGSRLWSKALACKCAAANAIGPQSAVAEAARALLGVEPDQEGAASFVYALSLSSAQLLITEQYALADDCALRMEQLGTPLLTRDPLVSPWIETACAVRAFFQGNAWASLVHYEAARAGFAGTGENQWSSVAQLGQGQCLLVLGAYAECQALVEPLLSRSGQAAPVVAAMAMGVLIDINIERGRFDEALAAITPWLDAALARQEHFVLIRLRSLLAKIELRRGDLLAAEREARLVVDAFATNRRDGALFLAMLADIHLAERRPEEALAAVKQALALQDGIPPAYRAGAYLPLMHAEALYGTGDHEGARAAITAAREGLLARADQIGNPVYRRSFLEDVRENAATLSRARQWLGCE